MSSFATYLIGFLILIVGLRIAAYLLNVPTMWIGVGVDRSDRHRRAQRDEPDQDARPGRRHCRTQRSSTERPDGVIRSGQSVACDETTAGSWDEPQVWQL